MRLVGVYAVEFPPGCGKYGNREERIFCRENTKTGKLILYPGYDGDPPLRGRAREYAKKRILEDMPDVIKSNLRKYPL